MVLKGPAITPCFESFQSSRLDSSTLSCSRLNSGLELVVFMTLMYLCHVNSSFVPELLIRMPSALACLTRCTSSTGSITRPFEFSIHRRRFSACFRHHSILHREVSRHPCSQHLILRPLLLELLMQCSLGNLGTCSDARA